MIKIRFFFSTLQFNSISNFLFKSGNILPVISKTINSNFAERDFLYKTKISLSILLCKYFLYSFDEQNIKMSKKYSIIHIQQIQLIILLSSVSLSSWKVGKCRFFWRKFCWPQSTLQKLNKFEKFATTISVMQFYYVTYKN